MNEKMLEKVKAVVDKSVNDGILPCASVLFWQEGEEKVYYETGYSDMEAKKPFCRDTLCHLYSLTKPVTSAAVYSLVERGVISLEEDVRKYLPGFTNLRVEKNGEIVPASRPIRIRELLSMQSGMLYNGKSPAGQDAGIRFKKMEDTCGDADAMTTVEFANYLGEGIAQFPAREGWAYGSGADILGAIVEVASGMRFGDYLKKTIFAPLGMKDTDFCVPAEKADRMAKYYKLTPDGLVHDTYNHLGVMNVPDHRPNFESGGAGLLSTLNDMLLFGRMMLGEGELSGTRVLEKHTVRLMTKPQLTEAERSQYWNYFTTNRGFNYGNLMRIGEAPELGLTMAFKGEFGWDGWTGPFMSVLPNEHAIFLLMTQRGGAGFCTTTVKVRNAIYSLLED